MWSTNGQPGSPPRYATGAGVWSHKLYKKKQKPLKKRALRFHMWVHKFAPIPGIVGWLLTYYRHKLEIIRLWNRLILMNNSRLANKYFCGFIQIPR